MHTDQQRIQLGKVTLSNPDRVLYAGQGITKRHLAQYYSVVGKLMLPFVAGRPLSLLRCPHGQGEDCFFQRHLDQSAPEAIDSVEIEDSNGRSRYVVIHDMSGLISLVQLGVLEIHPWGARADAPDLADTLVFDLDPGAGAAWTDALHGAHWLHGRLAEIGLKAYPRLTGGKGIHVVLPLNPGVEWDVAKAFSRALAKELAEYDPNRFVDEAAKSKRIGKVFVDYLRNARGASSIANYSPRARRGAPVATPMLWPELKMLESPDHYNVGNLPFRVRAMRTPPWDDYFSVRQSIDREQMESVRAYV